MKKVFKKKQLVRIGHNYFKNGSQDKFQINVKGTIDF